MIPTTNDHHSLLLRQIVETSKKRSFWNASNNNSRMDLGDNNDNQLEQCHLRKRHKTLSTTTTNNGNGINSSHDMGSSHQNSEVAMQTEIGNRGTLPDNETAMGDAEPTTTPSENPATTTTASSAPNPPIRYCYYCSCYYCSCRAVAMGHPRGVFYSTSG